MKKEVCEVCLFSGLAKLLKKMIRIAIRIRYNIKNDRLKNEKKLSPPV